jgi:hypothetical protein
MKKLIIGLAVLFSSCVESKNYCGKIVDKYLVHKNNGGVYNIVIFNKELNKKINVNVDDNTYVNNEIGDIICFELTEYQIK